MRPHHIEQLPLFPHPGLDRYVDLIAATELPELLPPSHVARLLCIDRRRVYELAATGELACVRAGPRNLRVFRDSLLDWLRAGGCGRPFAQPPNAPRKKIRFNE